MAPVPKAKAKAKAEPVAEVVAQPKANAQSVKAPKEAVAPVVAPKAEKLDAIPTIVDDGTGGDWGVATGLKKKDQRRKERQDEVSKQNKLSQEHGSAGTRHIPGFAPASELIAQATGGSRIPGMAPVGAAAKGATSQAVNATAATTVPAAADTAKPESHSATIHVPENKAGIVIGPKGSKIKLIQEKTETRIDTSGDDFTITGPAQGVAIAEQAIRDLITKGYTSLAYEDFQENFVMVGRESFPDLIGKKGAVVIALKEALSVEVTFPETKADAPGKKYKVTIAGANKAVETAKEVINSIVLYGHHEITHPDDSHEEIEVPSWAYAAIIGKKGSELRHIQNSFKVRVNIPREGSANENVVVVGDKEMVPRAKAYIDKLVHNFSNQSRGRDKSEGAADDWGDEGPEEDWMKAYIYKR